MKKKVIKNRLGPPTNLRHHAGSHDDKRIPEDKKLLDKDIREGENEYSQTYIRPASE